MIRVEIYVDYKLATKKSTSITDSIDNFKHY